MNSDRPPIRDRTLVLRVLVPGLEARLRDKMKEMKDVAAASLGESKTTKDDGLCLDLDGVTCEPTTARNQTLWNFHCDGAIYPAQLVNLPCPVEIHKTHDHAMYYKCSDVAQMLIVYEDEIALEEAAANLNSDPDGTKKTSSTTSSNIDGFPSYYPSGLTPPTHRIVPTKFAAREHKAVAPPRAAAAQVEADLLQLMGKLVETSSNSGSSKRNKVPTLTNAVKVLEEVVEEVVEYEPWMSDYGRQPHGVEFEAEDPTCSQHPEVWLSPHEVEKIQQAQQVQDALRKQEHEAAQKKKSKRKDKKKASKNKITNEIAESSAPTQKKGIASKKHTEVVDEVTAAAVASMLSGDAEFADLMDEDDDVFDFADEDIDLANLGLDM